VEEQEPQHDVGALGGEPVGVALAVAFHQTMPLMDLLGGPKQTAAPL
jgi:hypothetical protein